MGTAIIGPDAPVPEHLAGAVVALGNFDGVHRGHQALLSAARGFAEAARRSFAAAVFEPHPRRFFQPDAAPFRLQSGGQRARALAAEGAAAIFEIGFDAKLAALSAADFCAEVLARRLRASAIVVGEDFRFGRGREGDCAALARFGAALGFEARIAPVVGGAEGKVSSSDIRQRLAEGRPDAAAALLGRPFAIEGAVVQGAQRGRTIGFPTANVPLGDYLRPRFGVYAVTVRTGDGAVRPGVANLGIKPTVSADPAPLLEAHVFDFEGDLYGQVIEVALVAFLRAERKFESFASLTAQIGEDAMNARAALA
jgi:riboflavin kinase/FMN adenylyltransferase